MPPPASIRFEPSEPYEGLARIVVLLTTNYVGTVAEQRNGAYEFIPNGGGPFCASLRLPTGPHVAKTYPAIQRLVRGLLKNQEPPAPPPRYVVVRPNGKVWNRPFTSEAAAWRVVVKSTNGPVDWRRCKTKALRTNLTAIASRLCVEAAGSSGGRSALGGAARHCAVSPANALTRTCRRYRSPGLPAAR